MPVNGMLTEISPFGAVRSHRTATPTGHCFQFGDRGTHVCGLRDVDSGTNWVRNII